MQCPECHARISDLREFCPECGAPTRARRRWTRSSPSERSPLGARSPVESDERTEPELKRNRGRVFMLGGALLIGLFFLGKVNIDIDGDQLRGLTRDAPRSGPAVVTSQQLYQEYFADAEAADDRYRNREMVVSGPFVRVVPDGQGNPDLRLGTSNPNSQWGADLIPVSHEAATQLRPGQQVTVSCQRMNRTGEERWLQNCAIQNVAEPEGEAAAIGSDAAALKAAALEAAAEAREEGRAAAAEGMEAAREAGAVAREAAAAAREAAAREREAARNAQ